MLEYPAQFIVGDSHLLSVLVPPPHPGPKRSQQPPVSYAAAGSRIVTGPTWHVAFDPHPDPHVPTAFPFSAQLIYQVFDWGVCPQLSVVGLLELLIVQVPFTPV